MNVHKSTLYFVVQVLKISFILKVSRLSVEISVGKCRTILFMGCVAHWANSFSLVV